MSKTQMFQRKHVLQHDLIYKEKKGVCVCVSMVFC